MANLIPKITADGVTVGHVPNRASKNPVIGVVRCECGEPATVHNPKGNRKGRFYTICDECGTNQSSGDFRQKWLRNNMADTVEELPEKSPGISSETAKPEQQPAEPVELEAPPKPQADPVKAVEAPAEAPKSKPPEAANDAVSTANQPEEKAEAASLFNKPKGLLAAGCFVIGGILALVA